MDRISHLPQTILQHILCFLDQDEAVRTCVLSKAWGLLWSTRPKIEFYETFFKGDRVKFLSTLSKTLHEYYDKKLSVGEFRLHISKFDSQSFSLLQKWISAALNMSIEKFFLTGWSTSTWRPRDLELCDLLPMIFEGESIRDLSLVRCMLNLKKAPTKVPMKNNLRRLVLEHVCMDDETFNNVIVSCPLIEHMSLTDCQGLRTIEMGEKLHNLKEFNITHREIEICSLPSSLEKIEIAANSTWFGKNKIFPSLKCLSLYLVRFPCDSMENFPCDSFPVLEKLILNYCNGFKELHVLSHSIKELILNYCGGLEEFHLFSHSIKHLSILSKDKSIKVVAINAPSIHSFRFEGCFPPSIFFATVNSKTWRSSIDLLFDTSSSIMWFIWFTKLREMVRVLKRSEIFLCVSITESPNLVLAQNIGVHDQPPMVEKLSLRIHSYSSAISFLKCFRRICRPKNIGYCFHCDNPVNEKKEKEMIKSPCFSVISSTDYDEKLRKLREFCLQKVVEELSK